MSDTLSEAERLLNTIVSSRMRLASLRGDPAPQADPVPDDIASPGRPRLNPTDAQPEPITAPHGESPLIESTPSAPHERQGVPSETEMLTEPAPTPALVLGIPDPDDTEDEDPLFEASIFDPIDDGAPSTEDPTRNTEDGPDPFSFLDLIPEPKSAATSEPLVTPDPLDSPPPIRPPAMPLPSALAAGAPVAAPSQQTVNATDEPVSTESDRPNRETEADEADGFEVIESLQPYGLAKPRAVAPQVLDPDRERLDVEVFPERSEPDAWHSAVDYGPTPRLTEPSAPPVVATSYAPIQPDEAVFDALSHAQQALRRGTLGDAYMHLTDALDWNPTHLEARLMRGRCARDLGDRVAALSDFTRAMLTAPHSPMPHVDLGDLCFAVKDYAQAIAHYTEAVTRDPDHAMALCRRGICHHYRRRPELALDDLQAAARVNPDIANIDRYIRMVSRTSR